MYKELDNEQLLKELDTERSRRFSDEAKMKAMIGELITRGVYPKETVPGNPTKDIYRMVSGYGVYWFQWREPLNCWHCKADLRNLESGPPFKREIGRYDDRLDRTVYTTCPDCGGTMA